MKEFLWIDIQENLYACDNIQKKWPSMMIYPDWCVMCKAASESHTHLFSHCEFANVVWSKMFKIFGLSWCFPKGCKDALLQLVVGSPFKRKVLVLWRNMVSDTLWRLWFERTQRVLKDIEAIFEGSLKSFVITAL